MDFWVYDLSSLQFRVDRDGGRFAVLTADGDELVTIKKPERSSDRETVFAALDRALATAKVVRPEGRLPVALLNPYSNQVAVGAIPVTVTYQCPDTIRIPKHGVGAMLRDGLLQIDGVELVPVVVDMQSVMDALTAHRD